MAISAAVMLCSDAKISASICWCKYSTIYCLIIDHLFLHDCRHFTIIVLLVAKAGYKSCFANGILDTSGRKQMGRSGGCDAIFFDHNGSEILGDGGEADLGHLFADGEHGCRYFYHGWDRGGGGKRV